MGLWENIIETAFDYLQKGYRLDEPTYNQRLFRRHILHDDVWDVIQDNMQYVISQVVRITPKGYLEYKPAYKLVYPKNIMVEIDVRDMLIPNPLKPEPLEWNPYDSD